MHHTYTVFESLVGSTRIDIMCPAKLIYISQTLENGMIDNTPLKLIEVNESMNGISNSEFLRGGHIHPYRNGLSEVTKKLYFKKGERGGGEK